MQLAEVPLRSAFQVSAIIHAGLAAPYEASEPNWATDCWFHQQSRRLAQHSASALMRERKPQLENMCAMSGNGNSSAGRHFTIIFDQPTIGEYKMDEIYQ